MALSKTRLEAELTAKEIGWGSTFNRLQAKTSYLEDKANVISGAQDFKRCQA